MKRIKTIIEEKYFKIESKDLYIYGYGCNDIYKGRIYYDELFITEEECQNKLNLAIKQWEKMDYYIRAEKPTLTFYWKELKETIQEE